MRRPRMRSRHSALVQPLERRQLLAATATIQSLGVAPWSYASSVSVTLGPGSRELIGEVRNERDAFYNPSGYASFSMGSHTYTVSSNRAEVTAKFSAFDASGRAIVSFAREWDPNTGGRETVIFPADGSTPFRVAGLPAAQQTAYENVIAISPNGAILSVHQEPSLGNQQVLSRLHNGVVTSTLLGNSFGIASAAMNDAGDVVLAVTPSGARLEVVVLRNLQITARFDFAGNPSNPASRTLDTAISQTHGAVTAEGKLLRFPLNQPAVDPANLFTYAPAGGVGLRSDLVARGTDQFAVTSLYGSTSVARSALLSTYLTGSGVVASGYVTLANATSGGPFNSQESDGVSDIDTTADGRFGFGYDLLRTRPVSYQGGTEESYTAIGQLDSTPQPLKPDLARSAYDGTVSGNRTRWGANPGFYQGIYTTAPGGIMFQNVGDAPASGFDVEYYLSLDSTLSSDDILLRTDADGELAPAQVVNLSSYANQEADRQVYLPATVPPGFAATGSYYLILKLDASNAVAELDEANNVIAYPFDVDGVLPRTTIRGRVLDQHGAGVADQRVYLRPYYVSAYGAPAPTAITDSTGAYEIVAAADGELVVDGAFTVPAGGFYLDPTPSVVTRDFVMATGPENWNRIYGKVTDSAGAPAAGARIYRDANFNSRYDAGELVTQTTASGDYLLEFESTGGIHIAIDASGYLPADGVWFGGTVGQRRAVNFSAQVPPPALLNRVFFTVYRQEGYSTVGVADVRIYHDTNLNSVFDAGEPVVITDDQGKGVLEFYGAGLQHYSMDGNVEFSPAVGIWMTTTLAGGTFNEYFVIRTQTPSTPNVVGGRVTTPEGEPVAGIRVYRDSNYNDRFDAGEPAAITGPDGRYRLEFFDLSENHVTIDGTGFTPAGGVYFGSLGAGGQRTVDFTINTTTTRLIGTVFADTNGNGRMDSGESGVAGRTVFADYNYNGRLDAGEPSAVTDADGVYQLATRPRQVSLTLSVGDGESISLPYGATALWFSSVNGTQSAKPIGLISNRTITGTIFLDTNRNGRLDGGENKLAGRTVFADYNYNGVPDAGEPQAVTDADGLYQLLPRAVQVSVRLVVGIGEAVSLPYGAISLWFPTVAGTMTGKNIGLLML